MTMKNTKMFNLAKEISELSNFKRQHIGCVIVYKSHILSIGYNSNKTHPIQQIYNKYRYLNGNNIQLQRT